MRPRMNQPRPSRGHDSFYHNQDPISPTRACSNRHGGNPNRHMHSDHYNNNGPYNRGGKFGGYRYNNTHEYIYGSSYVRRNSCDLQEFLLSQWRSFESSNNHLQFINGDSTSDYNSDQLHHNSAGPWQRGIVIPSQSQEDTASPLSCESSPAKLPTGLTSTMFRNNNSSGMYRSTKQQQDEANANSPNSRKSRLGYGQQEMSRFTPEKHWTHIVAGQISNDLSSPNSKSKQFHPTNVISEQTENNNSSRTPNKRHQSASSTSLTGLGPSLDKDNSEFFTPDAPSSPSLSSCNNNNNNNPQVQSLNDTLVPATDPGDMKHRNRMSSFETTSSSINIDDDENMTNSDKQRMQSLSFDSNEFHSPNSSLAQSSTIHVKENPNDQ